MNLYLYIISLASIKIKLINYHLDLSLHWFLYKIHSPPPNQIHYLVFLMWCTHNKDKGHPENFLVYLVTVVIATDIIAFPAPTIKWWGYADWRADPGHPVLVNNSEGLVSMFLFFLFIHLLIHRTVGTSCRVMVNELDLWSYPLM